MILMKAMKSFRGQPHEGKVKMGMEFETHEDRAKELELHGLAYPIEPIPQAKMEPTHKNKMQPTPQNKAAEAGPLDIIGGRIGVENAPSSLAQARPPRQRRSKTSADALDL